MENIELKRKRLSEMMSFLRKTFKCSEHPDLSITGYVIQNNGTITYTTCCPDFRELVSDEIDKRK